eukprot:5041282-Pleurochrysis_carterae.AAC.4
METSAPPSLLHEEASAPPRRFRLGAARLNGRRRNASPSAVSSSSCTQGSHRDGATPTSHSSPSPSLKRSMCLDPRRAGRSAKCELADDCNPADELPIPSDWARDPHEGRPPRRTGDAWAALALRKARALITAMTRPGANHGAAVKIERREQERTRPDDVRPCCGKRSCLALGQAIAVVCAELANPCSHKVGKSTLVP